MEKSKTAAPPAANGEAAEVWLFPEGEEVATGAGPLTTADGAFGAVGFALGTPAAFGAGPAEARGGRT